MNLDLVLLGTGAWSPTAERGLTSTLIARGSEHLLVDCGEGTQRQMTLSSAGLGHVTAILVTHCHPDHVLGIPGLFATWSDARDAPLLVAGPEGTARLLAGFRRYHGRLAFPLEVREVRPGDELRREGYALRAVESRHSVPSVAWELEEDPRPGRLDAEAAARRGVRDGRELGKLAGGTDVRRPDGSVVAAREVVGPPRRGRRIVVTGDTMPAAAVERAARGADVLVHEATFLQRDADLAARAGHSTAREAAGVAARAGVELLVLTHVSHRYAGAEVAEEARAVFPAAVVPDDLDAVSVPLPEHGPPAFLPGGGRARRGGRVPVPQDR
ncbi:MAG: ribonuclease Z [Actinomycetota bacterium]